MKSRKTNRKVKRNSSGRKTLKRAQQFGGHLTPSKIVGFDLQDLSISYCVEELIVFAYNYYKELLAKTSDANPDDNITIICGGQSPAYYCLAMMNFDIYDPKRVNIIVLPHSMGGDKSVQANEKLHEKYCDVLKRKVGIENFYNNIVILDGVHSGAGVQALKAALYYCIKAKTTIHIHSINYSCDVAEIYVDKGFALKAEPRFSDTFPRLIMSYKASDFGSERKFIPMLLIGSTNKIAQCIIDVAKKYPKTDVRDTEWFKLNILEPIHKPLSYSSFLCGIKNFMSSTRTRHYSGFETLFKSSDTSPKKDCFKPIILIKGEPPNTYKVYQCPKCGIVCGTWAVSHPNDFFHKDQCEIKNKKPDENCDTQY